MPATTSQRRVSERWPKTVNFAGLLTALMVFVLVAAMSLIAVVTSYFTRRSVEELSNRIVSLTLARVELRTEALLRQAKTQNAQGLKLLSRHHLVTDDFNGLGGFFASSLEVLSDFTYLGLGRETNGDYLFCERLSNGITRVREYLEDESGRRVIRDWNWQGTNRALLKVAPWDGYDPRQRPFYQAAAASGHDTWTDTYMFWTGNERGALPGVTLASPFFDAQGKLAGVLNSDFDLEALCKFLAEVRRDVPGYPFVIEQRRDGSRRLIAHPDPSKVWSGKETPQATAPSEDLTAATFVKSVLDNEAKRTTIRSGQSLTFEAEGKRYFGSARELRSEGMPNWTIAVVIPVSEVMGSVYANDRRAFYLGLLCLALVCLLAVRVARRVATRLRELTLEAQAIGRLELQSQVKTPSRIEEMAWLETSIAEMKSSLRSFQKFVPIDVVREIVSSATEARLGGQPMELTLFFSDIADFTTVAETMHPEKLVQHVGEYLGEMSDVILSGRGTVDKFIGDGIMAFWGAPQPNTNHARDACRAALKSQRALAGLRKRWQQEGRPDLRARIGLHTGTVVVGNIGSEKRLNYTAIGDSVNLTSRLEGLNKFYGTEILISAACVNAAGQTIVSRPVDHVSVKGRNETVCVHELLAMVDEATEGMIRLAQLTAEAFEAYRRDDLLAAQEIYQRILETWPNDSVAAVMEKRCRQNADTPLTVDLNPALDGKGK